MDQNNWIIILMIGAGLLGGITNYFRIEQEEKSLFSFSKSVLMGVSASLLIPLFLKMISSDLLNGSIFDSSRQFILFGFCLIASLSSKAFIETISNRLINEVKDTKEKLEDIKKDIEPIISKESEAQEELANSFINGTGFSLDEDANKVINSLGSSRYAWRTPRGIAREIGLPLENVLSSLDWLSLNRLTVRASEKGRWGLTLLGRNILAKISSAKESEQKEKD